MCIIPIGCQEEAPTEHSYSPEEIAKKRELLGLNKPKEVEAKRPPMPDPEPPRPSLTPEPGLVALNPTLEQVAAMLPAEPIGTLTGTFFESPSTQTRPLRGLVVTQCGDGLVLQGVYAPAEGEDGPVHTTTAIPLVASELPANSSRRYEDSGFVIELDVTHSDLPRRFAGRLKITSKKTGLDFIKMSFDGPTLPALLPVEGAPSLEGYALMSSCYATGRYDLVTDSGERFSGFVNAIDYGNRGVPRIRIPLSPVDVIELLVIPPKPFTSFEQPATTKLQLVREPNSRPFVMLVDAHHHPQALDPTVAKGRNLRAKRSAPIKIGDASVTLTGKPPKGAAKGQPIAPRGDASSLWRARITLTDLETSLKVRGPLKDRKIKELSVDALLMDRRAPLSALPDGVELPTPPTKKPTTNEKAPPREDGAAEKRDPAPATP